MICASRATLLSHTRIALLTPVAAVAGSLYAHKLKMLVLGVCVGGAIILGAIKIELPEERVLTTEIIAVVACVAFLFLLGALLTTFDHVRFGGWTDDRTVLAPEDALPFLRAIMLNDRTAAANLLTFGPVHRRDRFDEIFDHWHQCIEPGLSIVTSEELQTVDHVLFRAAIPSLMKHRVDHDAFVVLIPMIENLDVPPGGNMQIAQVIMHRASIEPQIIDFNAINIARPAILR